MYFNVCFCFVDYFMKEIGPFSEIFANLENMNRAVSNALVESAKVCAIMLYNQGLLLSFWVPLECEFNSKMI